jgi:N-succinyldiaminopimelate aminotransferase
VISRLTPFGSSVFAEITALAKQFNAVNLGQGFPDFDTPEELKSIAAKAIMDGHNQYAVSAGEPTLREAIAEHSFRFYQQNVNPNTDVCVTSGASEALLCAMLGFIESGDEVIVFEPCFDVYLPGINWAGGKAVAVTLHAPEFRFDPDELKRAITPRTKAVLLNTPHNPTGTVFTLEELSLIRDICVEHNLICISDEVYEHIVFEPHKHIRIATLDGMENRTITISSGGKTFSATGWKCGWAIGSKDLIASIKRVHQFTVFASSTPQQYAIAHGLRLPDSFFQGLSYDYTVRRNRLFEGLSTSPLLIMPPQGTYFITAGISGFTEKDGAEFASWCIRELGVALIPLQKFYLNEQYGRPLVRLCFCKRDETLLQGVERLSLLSERIGTV